MPGVWYVRPTRLALFILTWCFTHARCVVCSQDYEIRALANSGVNPFAEPNTQQARRGKYQV
jgi:hypothetical protein